MDLLVVNGQDFKNFVLNGFESLKNDMQYVNDLNVFPVPDGDTGVNMKRTLENGIRNIVDSNDENIGNIATALARGMLLGARGNSGVILSQYFKGISNYLADKEKVDSLGLVQAFVCGYEIAYKAVVTPTEGTILTVCREGIDLVKGKVNEKTTVNELIHLMLEQMKISLEETPTKLDVLAEAGVVDSGGAGLVSIFTGIYSYLSGKPIATKFVPDQAVSSLPVKDFDPSLFNADSELTYGYCTEFILQLLNKKCDISKVTIDEFINYFSTFGDSIVAIKDNDIIKVHVHTKTPALVIEFAQKYGEFITWKMENMSIQNKEVQAREKAGLLLRQPKKKVHKKTAVVCVATGDGLEEKFTSMNCDIVLNGGQTMNTSTEEFIDAFKSLDADNIIVLPNNKNIIMAAKQAKDLYDKANIVIIPTKSIAEGYFALSMMIDPESDINDQVASMTSGIEGVQSGEVTYSIRDTNVDGVEVKKDEYIAILDKKLVCSEKTSFDATMKMIDKVEDIDSKSIVVIFVGQKGSMKDAEKIKAYIEELNCFMDVGIVDGKQDVYDYIVGIC